MSSASNDWLALTGRRIFFGHQSIGQNIIDGIWAMTEANRFPLRIVEGDDFGNLSEPAMLHSRLGVNRDPHSKIDAFASKIRNGIGSLADIALFKLCYVDIVASTDVQTLFRHYATILEQLKTEYPRVAFVHVTVPLTVAPPRWRHIAGHLLNRPVFSVADNIARTRFNELMRHAYVGREPLFDLARCEAGALTGKPNVRRDPQGSFEALDRRLTTDGGHLNKIGRKLTAAALLDCLTALAMIDTSNALRRTA